ncbi:MAG: iron export ABC transporter permease subunit FetB [Desulfuromonadales bacterium C00003096]|jgi:putative ABC transport system permease protein|nr:MAG: iron export ABC transporter permease subunit FetB [Desulfuromonadales bacterium C00003096]
MIEATYDPVEGLIKLGLAATLLAITIAISHIKRLQLSRELGIAAVRGFLQLMAVALVITAVFQSESLLLVVLILSMMLIIAAHTSAKRAERLPRPFAVTLPAISIGASSTLMAMVVIGVIPTEPEFVIPIGSMIIGGSMVVCSLTLERLAGEVSSNRDRIETSLCLGASSKEALEPYTRQGVAASLIPSIDSLKTLGIIVIPGAMSGMIIGGVNPLWAAEYQLIISFMFLAANITTTILATHLAERYLFTEAHQLIARGIEEAR